MNISGKSGNLSIEDLRSWTKSIQQKLHPGTQFSEEAFMKGFAMLDRNKDGQLNIDDIIIIVRAKCIKTDTYASKGR